MVIEIREPLQIQSMELRLGTGNIISYLQIGLIWKSSTEVDAMMQRATRQPRKIITSSLAG
ncbi:hypothetical protein C5167_016975 [Papaver somniferum]|uniref:Uncharacterized protein n=1 Tax=Papaver somniferum TaxID=3469 RepID=A0A4Y7ILE5_PAPSO|nr:hypothetical protein C5167_016975 [Papaver somniferum]